MSDREKSIPDKKNHPAEKIRLHKRNRHRERYDFPQLIETYPALSSFVTPNKYGDDSIDFANPEAVRILNTALLMHVYDITSWDIPSGYLCPPIPGRADYIHHIADMMSQKNYGKIPLGSSFTCMDIGVGASCIYPIIGVKEYGWSFIGTDIDKTSIASAQKIIENNPALQQKVTLMLQKNKQDIFRNVIQKDEYIDLTICNPPFHASEAEAQAGTIRKLKNLNLIGDKPVLNFGGKQTELWCEGGVLLDNFLLQ